MLLVRRSECLQTETFQVSVFTLCARRFVLHYRSLGCWFFSIAISAGCLNPASAASQLTGTVTAADGRPIPSALVELWGPEERIAATLSGSSGEFSFSNRLAARAAGVSVSVIGYRPALRPIADGQSVVNVALEVLPVSLPELTVLAVGRPCPNADDARGRALWQAASARYETRTGYRGRAYWARAENGSTHSAEVGHAPMQSPQHVSRAFSGSRDSWGGPGSGASVFRDKPLEEAVQQTGYAVRNQPSRRYLANRDFFDWLYPALGAQHAYHFATEAFGGLHTFSIIDETAESSRLTFCPAYGGPAVEGTIIIGSDGTFHSADWSFRTPSPDERAGGEVIFAPWAAGDGELPHLVAARSLFWRRVRGRDLVYRNSAVFDCWVISDTEDAPRLPTRPPESFGCPRSAEAAK